MRKAFGIPSAPSAPMGRDNLKPGPADAAPSDTLPIEPERDP